MVRIWNAIGKSVRTDSLPALRLKKNVFDGRFNRTLQIFSDKIYCLDHRMTWRPSESSHWRSFTVTLSLFRLSLHSHFQITKIWREESGRDSDPHFRHLDPLCVLNFLFQTSVEVMKIAWRLDCHSVHQNPSQIGCRYSLSPHWIYFESLCHRSWPQLLVVELSIQIIVTIWLSPAHKVLHEKSWMPLSSLNTRQPFWNRCSQVKLPDLI